jgi:hypothetical protein
MVTSTATVFYSEGISYSEYGGDLDTRISVYGYVLYFCGAPISWKSKAGKSVTLSCTEAKYYATSEIAKELICANNLLEEITVSYHHQMWQCGSNLSSKQPL